MSATEQTAAPAPTESDKPKRDGTEYVVLELKEDADEAWSVIDSVRAGSAQAAISAILPGFTPNKGGTYVAVPVRSWKPVKVSVETVSRVKLEEA